MPHRQELADRANELGVLLKGNFQLSSGGESEYYFDGRVLSLDPVGIRLLTSIFIPMVVESGADLVCGLTSGADALVSGIVARCTLGGDKPLSGFYVRKRAKNHGAKYSIKTEGTPTLIDKEEIRKNRAWRSTEGLKEGGFEQGTRVAVFDDTRTTGKSLDRVIRIVQILGGIVVFVGVILDRCEGESEKQRQKKYKVTSLLKVTQEDKLVPSEGVLA